MKIDDWLTTAEQTLRQADVESARLDAQLLLEDTIGHDRAYLLAHPDGIINAEFLPVLEIELARRASHEPLAYIRGHAEFYGRTFQIAPTVLVPRPETETMIDLLKKYVRSTDTLADIGTGSGALAITATLETDCVATAVDIDEACLAVARENAVLHTAQIELVQGDLLAPLQQLPDVLLCNLPYVPDEYEINAAAKHEPALALFAGSDGLDLYRRLFDQLNTQDQKPRLILTEALESQHEPLAQLAAAHGYGLMKTDGLVQAYTISPDIPAL